MVAAGYGTTLIPGLATGALGGRGVVLRPLLGGIPRTIRLASRPGFPRPRALKAIERIIREAMFSAIVNWKCRGTPDTAR